MPRTKDQYDDMRETMRRRILEGAVVCFALNGYSGTRISELAKAIGIGQGTLYNYFASKEDVFQAILEQANTDNSEGFEALRQAPLPATEKIRFLSERMLEHIREESEVAFQLVLNFRMSEEGGSGNTFTESYSNTPSSALEEIILQGQGEGTVVPGDIRLLAEYYWSVVHSLAVLKIVHKSPDVIPSQWLTRLLVLDTATNI